MKVYKDKVNCVSEVNNIFGISTLSVGKGLGSSPAKYIYIWNFLVGPKLFRLRPSGIGLAPPLLMFVKCPVKNMNMVRMGMIFKS